MSIEIEIKNIQPGMKLAKNAAESEKGIILFSSGYVFLPASIDERKRQLIDWGLSKVTIYEDKDFKKNIEYVSFTSKSKTAAKVSEEAIINYKNEIEGYAGRAFKEQNKLKPTDDDIEPIKVIIKNIIESNIFDECLMKLLRYREDNYNTKILDHSINVMCYSMLLLNFLLELIMKKEKNSILTKNDDIIDMGIAAFLHDIGNISCGPDPWWKKWSPKNENYNKIKSKIIFKPHIDNIEEILSELTNSKKYLEIIKYHHSYLDGSGYPEINRVSYFTQILQVCDIYDIIWSRYKLDTKFTNFYYTKKINTHFYDLLCDLLEKNISNPIYEDLSWVSTNIYQ
jgi:response regulator RpfG family c-di-GMP phosphodiesterase